MWDENWFSFTCLATQTQIQMRGDGMPAPSPDTTVPGGSLARPCLPAALRGGSQAVLSDSWDSAHFFCLESSLLYKETGPLRDLQPHHEQQARTAQSSHLPGIHGRK